METKNNLLFFRIDIKYYNKFNVIKSMYQLKNNNFKLYNSDIFYLMLKCIAHHLKIENKYIDIKNINKGKEFVNILNRTGKREVIPKTNSNNKKELQIYLTDSQLDVFFNICYSLINQDSKVHNFDKILSKNYFFYDVIDYIDSIKNSFYKNHF